MQDYQKYKWFFTSAGNLVVGGKSASQNDELLRRIKQSRQELIVMHTSSPGSPFTVILQDPNKVSASELEQIAIFTACFSREWRLGKDKASIDIFKASQLSKSKGAKTGSWAVKSKIKHETVNLELVLAKQNNVLRAVPESSVMSSEILLKIKPGKEDKVKALAKLKELLSGFPDEEILSALPAGGLSIATSSKNSKQKAKKPEKIVISKPKKRKTAKKRK